MDHDLLLALRDDLRAADFTLAAIERELGSEADGARQRGVMAPARARLEHRDADAQSHPRPQQDGDAESRVGVRLRTMIRAFLLGEELPHADFDRAFPRLGYVGLRALGLVSPVADTTAGRAALSLNPVALPDPVGDASGVVEWWILSDLDDHLRHGPAGPDHVMGVGGATRSLLSQAPVLPADQARSATALDLGTGCGIVALHLARAGFGRVVATDISDRALRLARANAVLAGLADRIEFRRSDLFAECKRRGERFDLILSNPPFVITPRHAAVPRYDYRDGGMRGDALARAVIEQGSSYLRPGGTLVCLANWESQWGADGLHRVREWIAGASEEADLAAWVIERDRVSPLQYAETWVRDGGARPGSPEFESLLRAWLDDFRDRQVVSVGLGSVRIRRVPTAERHADEPTRRASAPAIRAEAATGAFAERPARALDAAFAAGSRAAAMSDAEVLERRWIRLPGVREHREYQPGAEDPSSLSLVVTQPLARVITVDPILAGAVGACDGELELGRIADALALLLEADPDPVADALVDGVRELAWCGVLEPALDTSGERLASGDSARLDA